MEALSFSSLCDDYRQLPEGCKLTDKRVRVIGEVTGVRSATQVSMPLVSLTRMSTSVVFT
jgi:hypothetical protein